VPIYEYECAKCGEFEITQRITDPTLKKCPTCKGKVKRLISTTSFQLKGSGWYVTDYGKSGGAKPAAKGESSESKTESKGESKSSSEPSPSPASKSTEKAVAA
jgi:putative FmdB family regulatory protein